MARRQLKDDVLRSASASGSLTIEEVTKRDTPDGVEAKSVSARIRTVEDLLRHIEADMTRFEIVSSEATKWEGLTADRETGEPVVTELHRVHVRLKPRGGPTMVECVEAMIAAATLRRPLTKTVKAPKRDGLWQVLPVADTHFGNYAWSQTTGGGDWDLSIAERVVGDAANELLAVGNVHRPTRRTIAFIGDLFHYDRAERAETSSGTPLERDGRLQKMIQVGSDVLLGIVERSAETVPTDVVLVHGNHDETLSWAFQRILLERFRNDRRVTIEQRYTGRKYLKHGANLLGFAHGHRAKKRLPQIMAIEAAAEWSACPYREWLTGHYHSSAAEWSRPLDTVDGVLVRTIASPCASDDWHAAQGFLNTRQGMETFIYSPTGGLTAMHVSTPPKGRT